MICSRPIPHLVLSSEKKLKIFATLYFMISSYQKEFFHKKIPEIFWHFIIFDFPQFHQEAYKIRQTRALQGLRRFQ